MYKTYVYFRMEKEINLIYEFKMEKIMLVTMALSSILINVSNLLISKTKIPVNTKLKHS